MPFRNSPPGASPVTQTVPTTTPGGEAALLLSDFGVGCRWWMSTDPLSLISSTDCWKLRLNYKKPDFTGHGADGIASVLATYGRRCG